MLFHRCGINFHVSNPVETTRWLQRIKLYTLDEDIVHAVSKDMEKHEQGTGSGSCSWTN